MRRSIVAAALLAASCAPSGSAGTPPTPVLHAYSTVTAAPTADRVSGALVSVETPAASPTPASYIIKAGDTLSQIAERARISVDALLLANPGLDPNALRVGATLNVPSAVGGAAASTPTPVPVEILDVDCRPMATGSSWCFALIHNDSSDFLENVTGVISILDSTGTVLSSQDVALLLDVLPPGASMPLAVPFTGPLPLDIRPQVRIVTAMRIPSSTPRYLPAVAQNVLTQVSWSGRSADVSGELSLPPAVSNANQIWLAAMAYDDAGRLVGWRRWESPGGLQAGTSMPFQISVYSLAARIERLDLVVQARP